MRFPIMAHLTKLVLLTIITSLLVVSGVSPAITAHAQGQTQFFAETGHTVAGDFLNFFNARGGLKIFGYPITDAFDWQGLRVQYFQKARFELHPENPYPYRVQLGLLGDELGYRKPAVAPIVNDAYRRYFPETGHVVAYAFLNFFDSNGGLDIFGYPISEFVLENGRIVQYFQRSKMEWHPELSVDQRVQLADLGSLHFQAARIDPFYNQPQPPANFATPVAPVGLKVVASVKSSITGSTGSQTVYAFVSDQTDKPISTTAVSFVMRVAGTERSLGMPPTNQRGATSLTFDLGNLPPGQVVVIEVHATYNGLMATAQTSFITWY